MSGRTSKLLRRYCASTDDDVRRWKRAWRRLSADARGFCAATMRRHLRLRELGEGVRKRRGRGKG